MLNDLVYTPSKYLTYKSRPVYVDYEPLPDGFTLSAAEPYCWLDISGPIESIHSWVVSIDWPGKDFPAMGFGVTPKAATEAAREYAMDLTDPEYREIVKNLGNQSVSDPVPIRMPDPVASADAKRRLRKSKDAERSVGRWLLEHDGADPRMRGIASSTLRTGHVTNMQIDVMSKTYAAEVKNIRVWASLWKFWNKIIDRAGEHSKQPLLVIVPTNAPIGLKRKVPELHIITAERHEQLLAAEKRVDESYDN